MDASSGRQIGRPGRFNPIHRMMLSGADFESGARVLPGGVGFADVDFAAVARGFGWDAERVERAEDLAPAFVRAAAGKRATLIDVVIDPSEYDAQILALRG